MKDLIIQDINNRILEAKSVRASRIEKIAYHKQQEELVTADCIRLEDNIKELINLKNKLENMT